MQDGASCTSAWANRPVDPCFPKEAMYKGCSYLLRSVNEMSRPSYLGDKQLVVNTFELKAAIRLITNGK